MANEQSADRSAAPLVEAEAVDEVPFVRPRKRRRQDDTDIDITPMIDVTFLLLIFFIVASRLDPQKSVDLPTAVHGLPVAEKTSVVLVVARGDGADALVYAGNSKDPQSLISGDMVDQEVRIRQYVAEELANNKTKQQVLIMAERGIKQRQVDRVIKAVGQSLDEQKLYVATMEEQ